MNKKVLEYIKNKNDEFQSNIDEETFRGIERYKFLYEDILLEDLKSIFAYFHYEFNGLFKELNSGRNRLNAEPSRYYLQVLEEYKSLKYNLEETDYIFELDSLYENKIIDLDKLIQSSGGTDIPDDFERTPIIDIKPIFKLLDTRSLELFQKVIEKLYDRNWDLGKTFQSKVRYKSFQNNLLTWETMLSDDEKKLLKNNWMYIREFVHEIFGSEVKIKNEIVQNIDIEKNKRLNQPQVIKKSRKIKIIEKKVKQKFSDKKIEYDFNYKNILLKGVPGTGKSRMIDTIIKRNLNLKNDHESNVLRINIHSASSNSDLMQGIAINSNDGNIEYKEKQGLILELIEKATFHPNQPFALVLEEIQENSLNELIGDLIYLIEDSKRADGYKADNKEYSYMELIDNIFEQSSQDIHSIKLPSLISQDEKSKKMIIPHNFFIFCTSNYRDDRKVIEDNLLRRFEVIEIYPKYKDEVKEFNNQEVSDFLKALNESIVKVLKSNGEIHPDRFMIGHSIWLKVKDKKGFLRAFLKVITEFKDVKEMHFDDFHKIIIELKFPFKIVKEYDGYEDWIKYLQNECYKFLN